MKLKGVLKDMEFAEEEEENCGICREPYTDEDHKVQTVCGHALGLECLSQWMFDEGNATCPVCRGDLFKELSQ